MTSGVRELKSMKSSDGRFVFRVPRDAGRLQQDQEWFSFQTKEGWRELRIHDYAEIYKVPGLYEALLYDVLGCRSPRRLVGLLTLVLDIWSHDPKDMRVLDLGAGNGIAGQRLRDAGYGHVIGVDILPEAAEAAKRDRPGAYDDYVVVDLTDPDTGSLDRIQAAKPNCLVTVAALGFGDIPPEAFRRAFNEIETPGWIALHIKEAFLDSGDETGFAALLRRMITQGIVTVEARLRLIHRVALSGEPLFYVGLVARKHRDIPAELVR
jgi:hypothetical protein